jgi:hypothetical protein
MPCEVPHDRRYLTLETTRTWKPRTSSLDPESQSAGRVGRLRGERVRPYQAPGRTHYSDDGEVYRYGRVCVAPQFFSVKIVRAILYREFRSVRLLTAPPAGTVGLYGPEDVDGCG